MPLSQQLIKESRISKWMVCFIAHLILQCYCFKLKIYPFSGNALTHSFNRTSASWNICVVSFHATNKFHHSSRTETDLPLLIGFSYCSNRSLSQCLHHDQKLNDKMNVMYSFLDWIMPLQLKSLENEIEMVWLYRYLTNRLCEFLNRVLQIWVMWNYLKFFHN